MLMHKEASLEGAMNSVNKELSEDRIECATLRRSWDEVLSKKRTLDTNPGKFLEVVSERTTESSLGMSNQFETEVVQGLEKLSSMSSMSLLRALVG